MDPAIKQTENEVKGIKRLVKKVYDASKNKTHEGKVSGFGVNYKLIIFFLLWGIGLWYFTARFGLLDYQWIADKLFDLLNLITQGLFQNSLNYETSKILWFIPTKFLTALIGYIIAGILAFDVYVLILYSYLSGQDEPGQVISRVLTKQLAWIGIILLIYLFLGTISIGFTAKNEDATPMTVANDKLEEIQNSYMMCILTNSFTDPTTCKKQQETKQAEESSKTKYEINLLPLSIETYDYTKRNKINFDYKFLTTGGYIKITKFECYYTKVDDKYLIDSQTFDDEVIMAENALMTKTYTCDLTKLENPKPNNNLKIIPILYYTINTEISQEIPIYTIKGYENDRDYFEARERYKMAFEDLSAIVSNKVINVKTRWSPLPPIFTNSEENNEEYKITFTFTRDDTKSSYSYGKILNSTLTNITIPNALDINCGEFNQKCDQPLEIDEKDKDDGKIILEMYIKLKDKDHDDFPDFVNMNLETKMQLKKTGGTILFKNPEYVDPTKTQEDENETKQTQSSTYWADKEAELNSIKTTITTEKNNNEVSSLNDDYEEVLTLIEQGFKVINDGKPLEAKEELTNEEKDQNQDYKKSYEIIETQIQNKRNDINQQKQELEQINYNGE